MRKRFSFVRGVAAEFRWSCAVALGVLCTVALCGAGPDKKAPPEPKAALWFTLSAFGICATALLVLVVRGSRASVMRWRIERQRRESEQRQLRELATAAVVLKKALGHALEHDWLKAHEVIATLPAAPFRDELTAAVSQLEQRKRAADLVRTFLERAERWADCDARQAEDRRDATLLAASELAGCVGVNLPSELCRHPYRDSQCCGICGYCFTSLVVLGEAGAL